MIRNRYMFLHSMCGPALLLIGATTSQAQVALHDNEPAAKPQEVNVERFVLTPAQPPYAALRYRLLPRFIEQSPGNAATQYPKALLLLNSKAYREAEDKIPDWNDLPLDQLRGNKQVEELLNECRPALDQVHLAARRMQCDWELPIREQRWIAVMLPEVQNMRSLARLLALKARYEIAEGKLDDAIETLKTGISLGKHVAEGPTLINGLVSIAICSLMFEQVKELIQQPGCPNLYWTLTVLPDPLIDLRPAMEMEGDGVLVFIPGLREVRDAKLSEAEWNALLAKVMGEVQQMRKAAKLGGKDDEPAPWITTLGMTAALASGYPKYQAQLVAAGYTKEQLDAMCGAQLILTATVETYDHVRDDNFKWFSVPYPQAKEGALLAQKEVAPGQAPIPLVQLLLPAARAARAAQVRQDRNIAALRCVEAIRLYAAMHDGNLPSVLSNIKEVQVPNNPQTGQPFSYKLESGHGTLESPAIGNPPEATTALQWQISIANQKK